MALLFVCYPKCSTCKKAEQWLKSRGIEYTFRDIKEDNPSKDELKNWYEKSGLDIKRFFNTSGLIYKELNLKDRLPGMTVDEKLELLSTDGMLVKRPILVGDDFVVTGFKEAEWEKHI
ncbi:MAG: arsenate reductase family protein [Lachnospiraceae bacterium]|nr:arsenate reductase family protein [Lachnospiraceae bacterium]